MKNIIVIGGGAAGFFSAINIAEQCPDAEVMILEGGRDVLQKVKISGGGRCNATHACWTPKELVKHYPRGQKALLGPFHRFACGDTIEWFEKRGVDLKIEDDGRMFPTTDDSQTIIDCLWKSAQKAGVKVYTQERVRKLKALENGRFQVHASQVIEADAVVVTAGSSKAVWAMLELLDHQIVPPVPSLFTFNIKDPRIKGLMGISMPMAEVQVMGQKNLNATGPLLITHWGMSGPGILKLSAWGARWMHEQKYQFNIRVNWIANQGHPESIREELLSLKQSLAKKFVHKNPQFGIPSRLWQALVQASGIDEQRKWADLSKKQLQALWQELSQAQYQVNGKSTFKEEFVTAGGVQLDEIDFTRFESKLHPNLFMAGEILNIDAVTGGFNFQAAWTGGWCIAQAVAD